MENVQSEYAKQAMGVWSTVSKEQREALLDAMGYSKDWAAIPNLAEVCRRGGAMVAKDIVRLLRMRAERRATA